MPSILPALLALLWRSICTLKGKLRVPVKETMAVLRQKNPRGGRGEAARLRMPTTLMLCTRGNSTLQVQATWHTLRFTTLAKIHYRPCDSIVHVSGKG